MVDLKSWGQGAARYRQGDCVWLLVVGPGVKKDGERCTGEGMCHGCRPRAGEHTPDQGRWPGKEEGMAGRSWAVIPVGDS